jgi:hypothetical protein
LSAQDRGAGLGRWRHDREKIMHPVENNNGYAMRGAKPHRLNTHMSTPSGHDDGGWMLAARRVCQTVSAIVDNERPALDAQRRVVGACRDN